MRLCVDHVDCTQGQLSFIVQTSAAASSLPVAAVNVEGGTVTGTSAVQGGGNRLFNVNVNSAQGASFVAVSTAAGVSLSDGLSTTMSNTVRVTLVSANPQVGILLSPSALHIRETC